MAPTPAPTVLTEGCPPADELAALRLVRVKMSRGGYAFSVGFPMSLRGVYLFRAVRAGYVVADVREVGRLDPRCATRAVVAVWCPSQQQLRIA